jgi:dethiobiotin synthetase
VGLRLGCINHALLTERAIYTDGLKLLGWIGNVMDSEMLCLDENIAALKKLILAPCLGIVPKLTEVTPEQVSSYINLPVEFEVENGRE